MKALLAIMILVVWAVIYAPVALALWVALTHADTRAARKEGFL